MRFFAFVSRPDSGKAADMPKASIIQPSAAVGGGDSTESTPPVEKVPQVIKPFESDSPAESPQPPTTPEEAKAAPLLPPADPPLPTVHVGNVAAEKLAQPPRNVEHTCGRCGRPAEWLKLPTQEYFCNVCAAPLVHQQKKNVIVPTQF